MNEIMNIFILDENITRCAQYHCDKHVVKMITEYNQLMSTACFLNGIHMEGMYRPTHKNHPCVKWIMESRENFKYLLKLNKALLEEYTYRYNRIHAGQRLIPLFEDILKIYPNGTGFKTDHVVCVNRDHLLNSDPISEYRNFYNRDKARFCTWKNRPVPYWFNLISS